MEIIYAIIGSTYFDVDYALDSEEGANDDKVAHSGSGSRFLYLALVVIQKRAINVFVSIQDYSLQSCENAYITEFAELIKKVFPLFSVVSKFFSM